MIRNNPDERSKHLVAPLKPSSLVELLSLDESPQCEMANPNTAGLKLSAEQRNRESRVSRNPSGDPVALTREARTAVSPHGLRSDTAGLPKTVRPLQGRARAHAIARRRLSIGCALLDGGDHARSPLLRIGVAGLALLRSAAGGVKCRFGAGLTFGFGERKLVHDVTSCRQQPGGSSAMFRFLREAAYEWCAGDH
jgi:hypothetical protein